MHFFWWLMVIFPRSLVNWLQYLPREWLFQPHNGVGNTTQCREEDVHTVFHYTYKGERLTGCVCCTRRSALCLTEHTGGAHSTTWAELNRLWSKGLIKRRHTTCPLALHFVHSGFMGKMMRARFPTRIGDLRWTSTVKTWENRNKRCGLKILL